MGEGVEIKYETSQTQMRHIGDNHYTVDSIVFGYQLKDINIVNKIEIRILNECILFTIIYYIRNRKYLKLFNNKY